ncbi:MAG: hypothetical protein JSU89_06000 [Myxococcales bacterium]|nr:MAG: hypothetical protein JSU89_06000 [Myxococcales bacterium]
MTTEIRDPQFANAVNEIVTSIQLPDVSFTLSAWEAVVGAVITFYDAFATPDRVILRHALNGIAF